LSLEELALEEPDAEDVPALYAIERRAYSHPWAEASLREAIERKDRFDSRVLRAARERAAPGRGLRAYCIVQRVADELHIHNLAVAPECRRRGLARRLLDDSLERASAGGIRVVLLEVRESNRAARKLYEQRGFVEVGRRPDYYDDPREDALLLNLELARSAC